MTSATFRFGNGRQSSMNTGISQSKGLNTKTFQSFSDQKFQQNGTYLLQWAIQVK